MEIHRACGHRLQSRNPQGTLREACKAEDGEVAFKRQGKGRSRNDLGPAVTRRRGEVRGMDEQGRAPPAGLSRASFRQKAGRSRARKIEVAKMMPMTRFNLRSAGGALGCGGPRRQRRQAECLAHRPERPSMGRTRAEPIERRSCGSLLGDLPAMAIFWQQAVAELTFQQKRD